MQSILSAAGVVSDEHVFLNGRPPLNEFLGFMSMQTLEGEVATTGDLAGVWREANKRVQQLEQTENGLADKQQVSELPERLHHLRDRVMNDAVVQRTFATVPFEVAMVELDKLVVYQKYINLGYTTRLLEVLPSDPTDEELFEFCLPIDRRYDPPMQGARTGQNVFTFVSPSNDFRFLDMNLIDPAAINDIGVVGVTSGVVGVAIGYGANYLSALRVNTRLVLNNGSHRAYALRERGFTHVPCLIQNVSSRDELEVVGNQPLLQHQDAYLAAPRPPMLKDYFDPALRSLVHVPRTNRQVRVIVQVETFDVPSGA